MTMKVTLYLTQTSLQRYKETHLPVQAASRHGGFGGEFIHEVQVDVQEVTFPEGLPVGHVHVKRPKDFGKLADQIINDYNRLQADVL